MFDAKQPFSVVDYGDGAKWDVLNPEAAKTKQIAADQFISLDWVTDGVKQIVGGYSHLQVPRTAKSLAQPMMQNEIETLVSNAKSKGICIYLFPDRMNTTVLRHMFPNDTDDELRANRKGGENDCLAMRFWLQTRGTTPKPISVCMGETKWYKNYKTYNDRTNVMLNAARRYNYPRHGVPIFHTGGTDYVAKHVFHELGFRYGGVPISVRYSVMACFQDSVTGDWRFFNGNKISARFVYDYVCGGPYGNGSVARSNVMFHWMRHQIAIKKNKGNKNIPIGHLDNDQYSKFVSQRIFFRNLLRILIRECRSIRDGIWECPKNEKECWTVKLGEPIQESLF